MTSEKLDLPGKSPRPVVIWLIVCAALVFAMVILGGLTRLTHAGLSIVDWRPLTGWLPPLDEVSWGTLFENYKKYPEYQKLNVGMTLQEFKSIFWLEYLHRLLGRTIGVAFLLPYLFFAYRRRFSRRLSAWLGGIFVLGAIQGIVGWWMVRSGLVNQPDVSHYRLAVHFGLAVMIYGLLVWLTLSLWWNGTADSGSERRPHWGALACLLGIFVVMLSGALVAGLDAGFAYNTFPTMNGMWIPDGVLAHSPWYANFFDNTITVHFDHRWLALATAAGVLFLWRHEHRKAPHRAVRLALHALGVGVLLQIALGIATVVLVVPVPLAAAHQAGAMVLFTTALIATYALRLPED